jgi:hypothetical protein
MQNQNNTLNQFNNLPSESPGCIIIQGGMMAEKKRNCHYFILQFKKYHWPSKKCPLEITYTLPYLIKINSSSLTRIKHC